MRTRTRTGIAALAADDHAAYVVAEGPRGTGSITRIDARTGAARTRALRSSRTHVAWSDVAVGAGYVWLGRGRLADPDGKGDGLLARLHPQQGDDRGKAVLHPVVDFPHQDVLTRDGLVLAGDLLLQLLADGHAVGHVARRRQDPAHLPRDILHP